MPYPPWLLRLFPWLHRRQAERELEEEIRLHLELETQRNLDLEMSPDEAARTARVKLGSAPVIKEDTRAVWGWQWVDDLGRDVRFGLRTFQRNPGFALTAMLIVALGIGATSAIFSVVNAVLLRPLPYPDPDRLVSIVRHQRTYDSPSHDGRTIAFLREHTRAFTGLAIVGSSPGLNLVSESGTEFISNLRVSADYFQVLGVPPVVGRSFSPQDEAEASAVILSHGLWVRHFRGSVKALGEAVRLGGQPYTVIGVMPPDFRSFPPVDAWVPFRPDHRGAGLNFQLVGRLRPERSRDQARSELAALAVALNEQQPDAIRGFERLGLVSYQRVLGQDTLPALLMLSIAVALFFFIVCSNTAGLLLARGSARRREIAVRAALGEGRGRIVRQLLTESLLLACAGGALGVAAAQWGVQALLSLRPETAVWDVGVDGRVLWAALSLSVLTGVLFGLTPALEGTRTDVREAIRGASSDARGAQVRRSFVLGQVVLSTVLLVGASLFIQTFINLRRVELGFDPNDLLTAQAALQGDSYQRTAAVADFYDRTIERIRQISGTTGTAVSNNLPVERGLNLPIRAPQPNAADPVASIDWRYVTPDYFQVMGIPLVAGRYFEPRDDSSAPAVALVNEAFVRRFFPGGAALGTQIDLYPFASDLNEQPRAVVGIVRDVKSGSLAGPPPPTMFVPVRQVSDTLLRMAHGFFQVNWVVRTQGSSAQVIPAIEDAIRSSAPELPVSGFRTMEQVIGASLTEQRFQTTLLTIFAVAALALAAAGLYGLTAYSVGRQTHDIGVRLALGATKGQVVAAFVRQAIWLGVLGTVGGVAAALLLIRGLRGLPAFAFGADLEPVTLAAVVSLLLAVSVLAAYIPARRVTRVDPMIALRTE